MSWRTASSSTAGERKARKPSIKIPNAIQSASEIQPWRISGAPSLVGRDEVAIGEKGNAGNGGGRAYSPTSTSTSERSGRKRSRAARPSRSRLEGQNGYHV